MSQPFFTIGYEQKTLPAVLDTLAEAGVSLVVDIRAVAASRRPGFSKRQFAAALDERGIAYVHLRGLGTPAEGRQAARGGKLDDLFRIYEAHLATDAARRELAELNGLAGGDRAVCLLCYESDPRGCHRRRVAELVCAATGRPVEHLIAPPF